EPFISKLLLRMTRSFQSRPSGSPKTVAASSNGTPCFSKLPIAFRVCQENIYCIYTNWDCFANSNLRTASERMTPMLPESAGWRRAGRPVGGSSLQRSHRVCDGEMDLFGGAV